MKKTILILIFTLTILPSFAQKPTTNPYAVVDKKALQMPDSLTKTTSGMASYINATFTTDKDKTRAIFVWIASNIQYDIDNMFAINFYEKKEEKISKPLKSKKGICENYAALFSDVCSKSGIRSYVIEGYTKQNGFTDYIPHAWCTAQIDSAWVMFDPTWGSGYVSNGKFVRKLNNDYYKVNPATLVKSHMPFDLLWQCLNYPVTNQEFYEGKIQANKSKPYFSYPDSIKAYEKQSHIEQLMASAARIEKNGIKNSLIYDRLQHIKLEIENERQEKTVNLYNSAVADYNSGINEFNEFIQYRNKQFTPKLSDAEIQVMIDAADHKLKEAKAKLSDIKNPDANASAMMSQLTKSIDDAASHVKEQQDWLMVYFSKGKSGRKSMFYERKATWFGIPLN